MAARFNLDEIKARTDLLSPSISAERVLLAHDIQCRDLRQDQHIRALIAQQAIDLARLDEISRGVEQAKQDLLEQHSQLKIAVAPIGICPPEILHLIFRHGWSFDRLGYPHEGNADLFRDISRVCARWRNIVLSHSEFWTCILTSWNQKLQNLYVTRSKGAPLHVYATGAGGDARGNQYSTALREASSRWRSFTTLSYIDQSMTFSYIREIEDLPALENIIVHHDPCHKVPEVPMEFGATYFPLLLPRLTSFSLVNHRLYQISTISADLKTLDLAGPTSFLDSYQWFDLQNCCPCLEDLTLRDQFLPIDLDGVTLITFPKLHTLTIGRGVWPRNRLFVLKHIRAPLLKNLTISYLDTSDDHIAERELIWLPTFIETAPLIETLAFKDNVERMTEVMLTLAAHSEIAHDANGNEFVGFLPKLQTLKFCISFVDRRTDLESFYSQVEGFILNRHPISTLQGLSFNWKWANLKIDTDRRTWLDDRVGRVTISAYNEEEALEYYASW